MSDKTKMGRPTVITDEVILKLEQAFLMGATDLEACFYADISQSTLYNYQDKNPDFLDRKDRLKQNPFMVARQTILEGLHDDSKLALDYMKNKKSDEFGTSTKQDVTSGGDKLSTVEVVIVKPKE